MELLSLSHRGSSEQNIPSDEEQGEMGRFRRLIPCRLISYTQRLEILAKALPHVNNFPVCVRKHFQNQIFV